MRVKTDFHLFMIPRKIFHLYLIVNNLFFTNSVSASTQYKSNNQKFYFSTNLMVGSLVLPLSESRHTLSIPSNILRKRVEQSKDDDTVEPLSISTPTSLTGINAIAEKIARPGRETKLLKYIQHELKNSQNHSDQKKTAQIAISPRIFNLIDPLQYADLFSKTHSYLTLDGNKLKENQMLRNQLFNQLSPFLTANDLLKIKDLIKSAEKIPIDEFMLPDFAKKMVRKFILHRGPNCFHAALSFQSIQLSSSPHVNVKRETGYHPAMINYDELWAVLNRNFYEVNIESESLKYGDMIVFFEIPENFKPEIPSSVVDYRWIRHTTTFLFNGYTFSKGSKSPNTPYAVRTLADEWSTWSKYTKRLGAKIFRRSHIGPSEKTEIPFDLQDWIL